MRNNNGITVEAAGIETATSPTSSTVRVGSGEESGTCAASSHVSRHQSATGRNSAVTSHPSVLTYWIQRKRDRIAERLEALISPEPNTGCWLFTGAVCSRGYGTFGIHGSGFRAHRVSYELFVGPIPDGLVLDHLCRQPGCVNPRHLEPVTNTENIRRGFSPMAINGRKTHCKRGHELTDENLIVDARGHRQCRPCLYMLQRRWYEKNAAKVIARVQARRARLAAKPEHLRGQPLNTATAEVAS